MSNSRLTFPNGEAIMQLLADLHSQDRNWLLAQLEGEDLQLVARLLQPEEADIPVHKPEPMVSVAEAIHEVARLKLAPSFIVAVWAERDATNSSVKPALRRAVLDSTRQYLAEPDAAAAEPQSTPQRGSPPRREWIKRCLKSLKQHF